MKIADLTVYNTNGKGSGAVDTVTVKRGDVVLAQVSMRKRNPLKYIRTYPRSSHRLKLVRQLRDNGVSDDLIGVILEQPVIAPAAIQSTVQRAIESQDALALAWFSIKQ